MRACVEQAGHVGHDGRPVEHFEKQRIVIQYVEDTGALFAHDLCHAGLRQALLLGHWRRRCITRWRALEQGTDVVRVQELFEDKVAIVVEEETFREGGAFVTGGGWRVLLNCRHSVRCYRFLPQLGLP